MNIRDSKGFYDLCVNLDGSHTENLHSTLSKLCEYGFKTIAINTNLDESVLATDKKKKKKNESETTQNIFPEVFDLESVREKFRGKLKILSRVTFFCSDTAKTHIFNHSTNLKKYDLYAFAPKTQNALQFACAQLNADLITLRPQFATLKLNKKLYDQAIERGIHFEIQYVDLISSETRIQTIHYAHLFHTYGKSKNVVLSSGSNTSNTVKNPYDLVNLGCILGLSEIKAKASILFQCKRLLLRAERRRRGKAVFVIKNKT